MRETITLTFGDNATSHIGMNLYGLNTELKDGFSNDDLKKCKSFFENENYDCLLYNLNDLLINSDINIDSNKIDEASLLVIKNGLNYFLKNNNASVNDLYNELKSFTWDTKYFDITRNKVLNKQARHNICFGDLNISPNYENKIGKSISFQNLSILNFIRKNLHNVIGIKAKSLVCEGNRYYDINKCGIGWHGDSERKKVIGFRIGETMDLCYNWYLKYKPIGEKLSIPLFNGDMYIMSEKAVGNDFKNSKILTLRHCAGITNSKYTLIKN